MNARFLESFYNADHTVLGYKLKPYCLAHVLALHAIKSPFMEDKAEIEPKDLILALKVCSHSEPFKMPSFYAGFRDWLRHRKMVKSREYFFEQCRAFMLYVEDHSNFPEFWETESQGKSLSAPWALSRIAALLTHSTLTEDRILTMPIGLVFWYCSAIAEYRGADIRFFEDGQIELARNAKEEKHHG